jgi:hypothetical protein
MYTVDFLWYSLRGGCRYNRFGYHSGRRFLDGCRGRHYRDGLRHDNRSRWRYRLRHRLWGRHRCGRGRGSRDTFSLRLTCIIALNGLFLQEPEDIIKDEIPIRLFGEEERLHEFTPRFAVVRHFTNDLDDDAAICGGLRIDGMDEDFAVLKADRSDLVVDFLLTVAWLAVLTLSAMDEGRSFSVKTVQTIWLLIDESIILGNKLPSDLRRNDIVVQSGGVSV